MADFICASRYPKQKICCSCKEKDFDFSMISVYEVRRLKHKMTKGYLFSIITHHSVTLTYHCKKCDGFGFVVMEYSPVGKEWWLGRYKRNRLVKKIGNDKLMQINGQIIKDCYDMQPGTSEDYNIITYNCISFARKLFNKIRALDINNYELKNIDIWG